MCVCISFICCLSHIMGLQNILKHNIIAWCTLKLKEGIFALSTSSVILSVFNIYELTMFNEKVKSDRLAFLKDSWPNATFNILMKSVNTDFIGNTIASPYVSCFCFIGRMCCSSETGGEKDSFARVDTLKSRDKQ